MKKILYVISVLFAVAFTACEPREPTAPATSNKVETGASENITQTSATLKGMVNVEIADYTSLEFGVMYAASVSEVNNRTAQKTPASVLQGKEFKVDITGLTANTKYYYCAYLLLNGMQYQYGAVKEFATLASNDTPDAPENPDTPDMPENPDTPEQPEDPSAKPFSVSSTKTVIFSPGNLQYHPANNEWRFAPNQTDYIGEANSNISSTYSGWIDLFGWGTGDNPTNASTDYEDYQTFVDWGVNQIGSYAPNTWRTLTDAEWEYLIEERPNYDKLIAVAQINGVNGLILLPDDWTCPSGVTFKSGFDDDDCKVCYGNYQTFSESDWATLEASGAVFFPVAGSRGGSDVGSVQRYGGYWSATEDNLIYLLISSDEAGMDSASRYYGLSVRLVRD